MAAIKGVPQAFPYQGSKRKQASLILQCIPDHTNRLIEPFAGSSAITMASAYKQKAKKFWLNDAHYPIAALWEEIVSNPQRLLRGYKRLWNQELGNEREFYNDVRTKFNQSNKPDCFLYLLARCVKAAIRYNRKGKFNNSPDHRRKGMHPDRMSENILLISEMVNKKIKITNKSYQDVLKRVNSNDVVYMDPPYQGVCGERDQRYCDSVTFDEFVVELEKLNNRDIQYIVSYDGRTGNKTYGKNLPNHLKLQHFEIPVGKSTQSTLLGKSHETYESLYLSSSLVESLGGTPPILENKMDSYLFAM